MTDEQLLGLVILAVGAYLVVCATWKRDFVLYRMKVGRVSGFLGERGGHIFYQILGGAMLVAGVLKAIGLWGPPN